MIERYTLPEMGAVWTDEARMRAWLQVEIAAVKPYGFSQGSESARVDYGIERFYLPEGEGLEIERDMNTRNFFMKVAVGRSGTAQIKAFFDGDRQLYAEPLY